MTDNVLWTTVKFDIQCLHYMGSYWGSVLLECLFSSDKLLLFLRLLTFDLTLIFGLVNTFECLDMAVIGDFRLRNGWVVVVRTSLITSTRRNPWVRHFTCIFLSTLGTVNDTDVSAMHSEVARAVCSPGRWH